MDPLAFYALYMYMKRLRTYAYVCNVLMCTELMIFV